ncbi:sensor histidine kinase [Pseudooceanicola sp. CBS1P-1]|uniref:histidine kinase n=1 Tax=Pseudooceanicola albus TaxID=2692189 RepID=A0A6L7G8R1_9RHOB|nr:MULTISPECIES: ATP-binding protein [Pseudooceanicola]MBT9384354.1 sensor histidine kinase [Pseudooceanicola endophyticus]MXN19908.1 sensor histidine kinase [Pseudooceanicola albus]
MSRAPRRHALARRLRTVWRRRLAAVVVGAALCATLAWQLGQMQLHEALEQAQLLSHRALRTEIDRFRYLPRVAGEDARVHAALTRPGDAGAVAAANRYLQTVTAHAGSDRLYLLDTAGVTIASSNWQDPDSYVGHNYSFRPYFRDALRDGRGSLYAIGITTGEPGYFISARIEDAAGRPLGVMVVKIDLRPLERAWAETGQQVAVTDAYGVVFLTGQPGWRYRPLHPLEDAALARIEASRLYPGADPGRADPLLGPGARVMIAGAGPGATLIGPKVEDGWQLMTAAPLWPARTGAGITFALVVLAGILGLGLADMRRHRRRLIALRLRQTEVMERKVSERTAALKREVEARTRAEADLRATQATLVQSEKMAALGRMSAAIVHEVSQPLAAMEATLTAAEFSLSRAPEQTAARLQSARGLIRRMQRMTKHLKNFSRREVAPLAPVSVTSVARSALQLAQPRADRAGIQPRLVAPEGPLRVLAGQVRLEQVLVNLLHNAIEAVEPGQGEVTLLLQPQDHRLRIAVRDNGPGIDPEILPRLTEPFFSTKIGGEGLGLGLAISSEVVQQFGGALEIGAAPGGGAEIAVVLPLLTGQEEETAA